VISSSQRPLPDNTQHSQETNIHAPDGIRNHNPSNRAAADPHLRPRGHRDRQDLILVTQNMFLKIKFQDKERKYRNYHRTSLKDVLDNQLDAALSSLYSFYCQVTLNVSGVFRTHHQECINCSYSHWYSTSHELMI
jgi:hypothetical protein